MNPFPLSDSDRSQFIHDVSGQISNMPDWGAIIQWRGRYVLAFVGANSNLFLTDISGGIPDSAVPGGVIPVSALIANTPKTQLSGAEVFLYSLASNFMDVARERMAQVEGAVSAITPGLGFIAVIAVAALAFLYVPRPRS